MPKKTYSWAAGALPEIAPHSLAKHRILGEYVQRYIRVLTAKPGIETLRLTLVDGFAGGGEYIGRDGTTIHPGSPQILIDAVRSAELAVNSTRTKPVSIDAKYIFIEKDPLVAKYLRDVLRRRDGEATPNGAIQVIQGAFETHVDSIVAAVRSRGRAGRVLFVLDQYGYTGVPVTTLSRIFEGLPNAEVFLTLAVGWITAYLPSAKLAAEKLGLSNEMISRLCLPNEELLDLGNSIQRPDLLAIQQILHHAFTTEVGSRFYTPFFIVSRESNRPYWFLHMANSARANDVVKTLHWELENHFEHFGKPGLVMLGYDPSEDPTVTHQMTFRFDDHAKLRTSQALLGELPRRLASSYTQGVKFEDLVAGLCNETPATRIHLAAAVRELCIAKEIEKVGEAGQRRAATTLPHNDDVLCLPRQRTLTFGRR